MTDHFHCGFVFLLARYKISLLALHIPQKTTLLLQSHVCTVHVKPEVLRANVDRFYKASTCLKGLGKAQKASRDKLCQPRSLTIVLCKDGSYCILLYFQPCTFRNILITKPTFLVFATYFQLACMMCRNIHYLLL